MYVSVVGLGKLGLSLALALADRGFRVIGVDKNKALVTELCNGETASVEPQVPELLKEHLRTKRFRPTVNVEQAVWGTDVTFIIVNTPSLPGGAFSPDFVLDACSGVGSALACSYRFHIIAIASTVMPGTCGGEIRTALERASGLTAGKSFGLCYVPEFVALGETVDGFKAPDFVIVGTNTPRAGLQMYRFYKRFCINDPPVVVMNLVNAEIAKIALNCYMTTKISYANQMANICENVPGANVDVVTAALGLDRRVAPAYLRGAAPYGGPCFPRDDRAMQALARQLRTSAALTQAVQGFNEGQANRLYMTVCRAIAKRKSPKLGILGLAFKPGTDYVEHSTGMQLYQRLKGVRPTVCYDPMVTVEHSVRDAATVAHESDVLVVTTADHAYQGLKFHKGQTVIDCWRLYDRVLVEAQGAEYVGIGVGPKGKNKYGSKSN